MLSSLFDIGWIEVMNDYSWIYRDPRIVEDGLL
jgi:hypothetical protein